MKITASAWQEMAAHAEQAYPEECCGALLGAPGVNPEVQAAVPLPNTHPSRRTRYEVAPEDLLAAVHAARAQGLELVAIYHSHPDHDAYFSPTDLEQACPWYSYVVLSVRKGRLAEVCCWRPRADLSAADPEPLEP